MPKVFPAACSGFCQFHVDIVPWLSSVNRWRKERRGAVDENLLSGFKLCLVAGVCASVGFVQGMEPCAIFFFYFGLLRLNLKQHAPAAPS